jgi:hypothetical protein
MFGNRNTESRMEVFPKFLVDTEDLRRTSREMIRLGMRILNVETWSGGGYYIYAQATPLQIRLIEEWRAAKI